MHEDGVGRALDGGTRTRMLGHGVAQPFVKLGRRVLLVTMALFRGVQRFSSALSAAASSLCVPALVEDA
ncbi:hypothetical protein [Streptomyces pseudovenezuelae]|uniref:hypothetical protein n=1 Tax=Streptomyces pseudovenezuelae TaxID=67350 RepID=UPI002E37ABCE|nr:hypothetical protein [Streptomyces pseudovenezuelae]